MESKWEDYHIITFFVKTETNVRCVLWRLTGLTHNLRTNCFLKLIVEENVEGRMEVKGRGGIRCKQLVNELTKGKKYWNLEEEALDSTLWRTHFVRQQTKE